MNMVENMLDQAFKSLTSRAFILHPDRGWQYREAEGIKTSLKNKAHRACPEKAIVWIMQPECFLEP